MGYWSFSLAVLLLGFLTGFSVGAFILPVGAALVVLGPVRRRPRVYWPALMAVAGFVVGYLLFVPLTCTATTAVPGGGGATVCQSILGPGYRTAGVGEPPTDLARLAGTVGAGFAAVATLGGLVVAQRRCSRTGRVFGGWPIRPLRRRARRASPGDEPRRDPEDSERRPTTRDWAQAWLWVGGLVLLAALVLWLNFGPRAT